MNSALRFVLLLVSVGLCASAAIKNCRCIKMSKSVNPALIVQLKDYPASSFCSRQQVIVTLKNKSQTCLDPRESFTKLLLKTHKQQLAARAKLRAASSSPSRAPETTSAVAMTS
ncbi:unnamed protein product [Menidia menidia]|uniref:C-X-C motif chemokine n=1 Tax=Menidia menidia TaxID=238744 RepID=A0A8S4C0H2_9TELE|nr:unnamed protein product [Menidia menidia]